MNFHLSGRRGRRRGGRGGGRGGGEEGGELEDIELLEDVEEFDGNGW